MKIVAIMPVRNEEWCIGLTARAILRWVDKLIILNHASTDGTMAILSQIRVHEEGSRIEWFSWGGDTWEEMRHRQMLLENARRCGATHIVHIDADELITCNLLPHMRSHFETLPRGMIMELPWICLRNGIGQQHGGGLWADQFASVGFLDDPIYHWQSEAGEEHFHHRHPKGRQMVPFRPVGRKDGGLFHLQFASERRLRAKQALYQITERLRWPERTPADYAMTVRESLASPAKVIPELWWNQYVDLLPHLNVDAEPWQEQRCRDLVQEHGRAMFAGLDLFGVV